MAAMMKLEDEDEDGEEPKEPPPEEPEEEEEEEEEESEEETESESESGSECESVNEAEVCRTKDCSRSKYVIELLLFCRTHPTRRRRSTWNPGLSGTRVGWRRSRRATTCCRPTWTGSRTKSTKLGKCAAHFSQTWTQLLQI